MKRIRHVCQAGSAFELVSSVTGDEVIGFADDCALGPLADVDTPAPLARIAFWKEVFSALADPPSGFDYSASLCAAYVQLSQLAEEASEVAIWAGAHPTEQALRRRIHWWLRGMSVPVTEVIVDAEDMMCISDRSGAPVALASRQRLQLRYRERVVVAPAMREQLAASWITLRQNAVGIRVWAGNRLLERPVEQFDPIILALAGRPPVCFAHALAHAMANTGLPDTFCRWRIAALVKAGRLSLAAADRHRLNLINKECNI
jgi:hypothetical protein